MEFISTIETGLYVVAAEVFLYGIYLALFGFYLHILLNSRQRANNRWLTVGTIALFLLSTAHCALQLVSTTLDNKALAQQVDHPNLLSGDGNTPRVYANRVANAVYVTSNVIADIIFTYRCYAIWSFSRRAIILPTFLTLAVAGLGYTNVFHSVQTSPDWIEAFRMDTFLFDQSVAVSAFTTLILMGLVGGRIWWIVRKARPILGGKMTAEYYGVSAMIMESGALYCAGAIPFVVVSAYFGTGYTTTGAVLGQLVGIAPTIIAVRVGLGRSVENVESLVAAQIRGDHPLEFIRGASPSGGQSIEGGDEDGRIRAEAAILAPPASNEAS